MISPGSVRLLGRPTTHDPRMPVPLPGTEPRIGAIALNRTINASASSARCITALSAAY